MAGSVTACSAAAAIGKPIGSSRSSARWASSEAVRARIGIALTVRASKPRSSSTAAIGIETFMTSGRPHAVGDAVADRPRQRDVLAGDPALVGQRQDPLRPRVERLVHRVPEAGDLAARGADLRRHRARPPRPGRRRARARVRQQLRALLRRAEQHRAGAEDPGGDRALERARIGRERHPRGDVRRHHPVLGDGHEQQVEEVALRPRSARRR